MLYHYLDFPKEFKVNKTLEKDKYLESANVTRAEKREINRCIKRVRILYDLVFPDKSETIVLEIELDRIINEYTMLDSARAVAKSISYSSIIVVTYKSPTNIVMAKLFTFYSRQNRIDHNRTRVLEEYSSRSFIVDSNSAGIKELLSDIRALIGNSASAAAFQKECIAAMIMHHFQQNETALPDKDEYIQELKRKEKEHRDELLDILESKPLIPISRYQNPFGTSMQDRFVSDCYNYCYGLYLEYSSDELYSKYADGISFDESSWLVDYIDACNDLAQLLSCEELNPTAMQMIKLYFDRKENYLTNNYSSEMFDDDELRQILDLYYNKDLLLEIKNLWEEDDEEEE